VTGRAARGAVSARQLVAAAAQDSIDIQIMVVAPGAAQPMPRFFGARPHKAVRDQTSTSQESRSGRSWSCGYRDVNGCKALQ
jgi:hypothetical protein